MTIWEVRIANTIKNETNLIIDYEIIRDNIVIRSDSVTLEGDVIDVGAMKGRIFKLLRKLKGIDEKSDQIIALKGKIFELSADGLNLTLKQ